MSQPVMRNSSTGSQTGAASTGLQSPPIRPHRMLHPSSSYIHCLGVAEGNVRILHWDDQVD